MSSLWHQYWTWVGGNIGALPLEFIITSVAAVLSAMIFRPLIRRAWAWFKHEVTAETHKEAALARRINADIYRHLTGEDHPHAPQE